MSDRHVLHADGDVLILSDIHAPYEHPDTVPFIRALCEKYSFAHCVSVGDEVDHHAMSFHDSDPDLPSAGQELRLAIKALRPLYKLFPRMHLVDSNHGSMVYRKGKYHGIPRKYLRDYGEILEAPPGWQWHLNMMIELKGGQRVFVTHGIRKNGMLLASMMGCCVIQGHYHTEFAIKYNSSPDQLYWSMQVGCLIDDESLAFHYNKTTDIRPIIGCGAIIDGQPKLLPMLLDKRGVWTGNVP